MVLPVGLKSLRVRQLQADFSELQGLGLLGENSPDLLDRVTLPEAIAQGQDNRPFELQTFPQSAGQQPGTTQKQQVLVVAEEPGQDAADDDDGRGQDRHGLITKIEAEQGGRSGEGTKSCHAGENLEIAPAALLKVIVDVAAIGS